MTAGSGNANVEVQKQAEGRAEGRAEHRAEGQIDTNTEATPLEFAITRTFDAPRELLWSAWTEEQHLITWLSPEGFTIPICKLSFVPGGLFHYCMRAPNGVEMWGKWIFKEIVPLERIVLVNTFSNKHGNPTRHPYVPDWPLEMLTTSTFTEHDGKSTIKIAWEPLNASVAEEKTFASMHAAMNQGWNGTLDKLAVYLTTL